MHYTFGPSHKIRRLAIMTIGFYKVMKYLKKSLLLVQFLSNGWITRVEKLDISFNIMAMAKNVLDQGIYLSMGIARRQIAFTSFTVVIGIVTIVKLDCII